ncbi:MAG TPA: DUF4115 domain-containing protein [Oxalobacteraceae bacterium]|jgi:cytoskeleton protein RodZ|nr:DUF4115 domain-containing protein [Oxalobacteraceae bacterium]HCN88661.1 DUF4115 domain-containing protein [Oxalobacteraceae bacterium]
MSEAAMNETMLSEQHMEPETSQRVPALGAQLAAERETRGWSIEQVATQLNLAPRQIQALELDDYAALPGMASVRGFIRAYAKLLKLDPTPLIAMISPKSGTPSESIVLRRALSSAPFFDNRSLSSHRRGLPIKLPLAALAALGLVVVLAVLFGEQTRWPSGALQPLVTVLKEWGVLPVVEAAGGSIAGAATPDDASAIANNPIAMAQMQVGPVVPAVASVPETAPATPASGTPSPASDGLGLVLKLREDSWVEIRRANNSVLMSRLMKAGSSESFDVEGPISLTLGNAAGVDASLRGAPVDLKPGTKNNIARLNLK